MRLHGWAILHSPWCMIISNFCLCVFAFTGVSFVWHMAHAKYKIILSRKYAYAYTSILSVLFCCISPLWFLMRWWILSLCQDRTRRDSKENKKNIKKRKEKKRNERTCQVLCKLMHVLIVCNLSSQYDT